MALRLRNPHSVLAALKQRPGAVIELRMRTRKPSGAWGEVAELAARHRVPFVYSAAHEERRPRKGATVDSERSGAAEAAVKEHPGVDLDTLFVDATSRRNCHGLWLALDQLQDPHNVGAIFRAASFFGIEGIVLTRDRSAPMSPVVYDVASGGAEYVPFSIETNLSSALERAKKAGIWVLGATEHAAKDIAAVPRDRPWLLVLGNEEKGLRRLTLERCDELCKLTSRGAIQSLNVSVAAAVLMSELTG